MLWVRFHNSPKWHLSFESFRPTGYTPTVCGEPSIGRPEQDHPPVFTHFPPDGPLCERCKEQEAP